MTEIEKQYLRCCFIHKTAVELGYAVSFDDGMPGYKASIILSELNADGVATHNTCFESIDECYFYLRGYTRASLVAVKAIQDGAK